MASARDPATHLRHAFVRDGHLTSLPTRAAMLEAACAFLVERFEPDRLYDESEVNAILADDAPDPATLRRRFSASRCRSMCRIAPGAASRVAFGSGMCRMCA